MRTAFHWETAFVFDAYAGQRDDASFAEIVITACLETIKGENCVAASDTFDPDRD